MGKQCNPAVVSPWRILYEKGVVNPFEQNSFAMSDIFQEVDEALHREKLEKLWKSYGPTLLAAAVVLVIATGASTAYRSWVSHQHQAATEKLIAAYEDADSAAALENAAKNAKGGLKTLALINAANKYADKKDFTKAASLYDQAVKEGGEQDLKDLADIYYVRAVQQAGVTDVPDAKTLAARMEPIAMNEKSAFHLQARIETALLYGDGLKDYAKALTFLKGFNDMNVSPSLKEKASALQHVYGFEAGKTTKPQP